MKRLMLLVCAGVMLAASAPSLRAAAASPEEEKEGTIAGTAIQRGEGWLGVEVKDGGFQLTFYNAKKHPMPADKASAVFWWPVHYQPNVERTELTATDNPAVLASSYHVKPPLSFKLHITLLGSDASSDPESFVIDFSG